MNDNEPKKNEGAGVTIPGTHEEMPKTILPKNAALEKNLDIPVPVRRHRENRCLQCGESVKHGENFCANDDCEIDYHFSGVNPAITVRYKRQMKIINDYKSRRSG